MSCTVSPYPIPSVLYLQWSKKTKPLRLTSASLFFSLGKAKGLRLQASKNTWSGSFSFSKQESTSSPKAEKGEPKKTITPVFNITTSKSSLHPAPPPATPLTPVVRPRRAHQEVLRPVVLAFPPAHFPDYFLPQHSRTGFSPSFNYNKRRSPAAAEPLSGTRLSKGAMVKPWPVF